MMQFSSFDVDVEGRRLRSKVSHVPAFVRFVNFTSFKVNVNWLDYEGYKRLYNIIGPDDFLDVNTFVTHLWIFENAANGDRLMGEYKYVFHPQSWKKENELAKKIDPNFQNTRMAIRRIIPVTYPLYSLKTRTLQVVRDLVSSTHDIESLRLPISLNNELKLLVKKKLCILYHKPPCSTCTIRITCKHK